MPDLIENPKTGFDNLIVVCFVDFLLHSKQLWSCRNGQSSLPHFSRTGLTQAVGLNSVRCLILYR